jgi:hypothetical protein
MNTFVKKFEDFLNDQNQKITKIPKEGEKKPKEDGSDIYLGGNTSTAGKGDLAKYPEGGI